MADGDGRYKEEYTKMKKLLKDQKDDKSVRGYTTHKSIIENARDQDDWNDVWKLIDDTLEYISDRTEKHVKQFTVGASEVRNGHDKEFDIKDITTWRVEGGVKARWNRLKHSFNGLIVLATTYDDFLWNGNLRSLQRQCSKRYGKLFIETPHTPADGHVKGTAAIYIAYAFTRVEYEDMVECRNILKQYTCKHMLCTNPSLEYDSLLKLKQRGTYAANLLDYSECSRYKELASELVEHTKQVITEIETKSTKTIMQFVIGQTFARKKKKTHFDPYRFETWKLDGGVNGRWSKKYRPDGYDGLIVLCAITRDTIPSDIKDTIEWMDQVECAKALEQRLIQHFMLDKVDSRVANKSFQTGSTAKKAYAGVVYLAYMLIDFPTKNKK